MTTYREIRFDDARPGDRIRLSEIDRNELTGKTVEITVERVRRGESVQYRYKKGSDSTEQNYPFLITSILGEVYIDSRLVSVGDFEDNLFRADCQWGRVDLRIEDDREALLQDLEIARRGDPGYDEPEDQHVFWGALARVIASAETTLGPGEARSERERSTVVVLAETIAEGVRTSREKSNPPAANIVEFTADELGD